MKLLGLRYLNTFFLSDKVFKQVIGIEKSMFQYLLSILSETYFLNHSGRGRKPKLSLSGILFMTLKYWRQYATQLELAVEFMVGESTVHDWVIWVENTLIADANVSLKGNESLKNSDVLRVCLVDVTESPIQRPKDKEIQKECYSGKKKFHTIKTQIIFDVQTKEITGLAFENGHCHDFTLYKESLGSNVAQEIKLLLDSGYQGILEFHTNSKIPKKSSKYHPLDEQDKQRNFEHSKARIPIEHVNAKIKVFKIFSTKYRNRRERFEIRMKLIYSKCTRFLISEEVY